MLNPNWLKTFVTLIDTGHFTKTADKLFMTQPGVSQHITKLEHACGHSLIRRDKKSFELTEQGRLVYQYAKKLADNEDELRENLAFDDPYTGRYSIACSGALALMLYPQLLDIQTKHPKLIVRLKAAPNQQILNEIQKGIIDIGIVTHISNHALFDVEELGQEQLCLVLPANTKVENLDEKKLTELGLVDHPDAEQYLSLYFAQSQDVRFTNVNISEIPVSGFVNQISQILQPVARGLGFTVLPKSAVDSFSEPEKLKIYQPQKAVLESLFLVKKKNRTLPARFEIIKSTLQAHLE